MTKYLTLLRHGEAEPAKGFNEDFYRPLSESGKYKLNRLGNVLKNRELAFDVSYISTALRTLETAEIINNYISISRKEAQMQLYLADAEVIFEALKTSPDDFNHIMLVGHNPGISAVLALLTNDYQINLAPGMMAMLELYTDSWEVGLNRGMGSLKEVLQ
ncbi:histidine phosphatase family protein [Echinicola marina]|uniref:SixA phosphatase family protein n=1 Tax=Echinicola marina TaxID=2859768 RepID=UPI001CF66EA5|nr:histidine phosphatase family protein [Echinicola marina]UCS92367.1 histidine phosphatase family protein [Echinicola marina]